MSRVSDILVRVRDSLSDPDETRWSTDRLVRLIDEAQKDMVQTAQMLRSKVDVAVTKDQATYKLPADAYLLTRVVTDDGGRIELLSHNDMDELGSFGQGNTAYNRSYYSSSNSGSQVRKRWEAETGNDIQYIIFDKQNPREFKVYPIPTDTDVAGAAFALSDFGLATLVEGDLVLSDFGVVSDLSSTSVDTTEFNSVFGVMTALQDVVKSLTVYYRRIPIDIVDTTSTLEIEPIWDKALRYYTIAMALADDQDTQNLSVADKYMGMYTRELSKAEAVSSKNNINSSPRSAEYSRAI